MTRSSTRGAAVLAAAALTIGGSVVAAPAQAAAADEIAVLDASFVWGISGYAQKGIFGPWVIDDLDGDVELLPGATQTEYLVAPVPATSFPTAPAGSAAPNGNAVKFTAGAGVVDHVDERLEIAWTGSYTVNGYPASFNAPDEIFSDPQLVVEDGDATVSFDVTIGAGVDINGDPTEPVSLGRITVLEASGVDLADVLDGSARVTPDFQGVTLPAEYGQTTNCTPGGTNTGWWGSWPLEFVSVMPESVRPHYVSTGCGGMQDNKPALPFDLTFGEAEAPAITAQPESVSGTHGNLRTFTVEATGVPAPTFQWQYQAPGEETWTDITSATSSTYSRALKVSDDGAKVRAVVTNLEGSATSDAASLSVVAATQATVVVDTTQLYNDRTSEVVVSGSGFDTTLAYGTRQPLPNQPSGTYVAFGKFADVWQPSTGAPSSSRVTASGDNGNGVSVLWAIPNATLAATSDAYAVLEADGTFEVTLKVDERWFDEALAGNFGIYTYPGGGADQPAYETYTPITFVDAPDAPLVAAPQDVSVEVGGTATFSAEATGADSLQWQSRSGEGEWADVEGATAATLEVAATSVSQSGTQYRVVAANDGGTVESAAATLTVTQATPGVKIAVKKNFRFASKTKATVTVGAPAGVAATGAVTIKAGKTVVGKGAVKGGKAVVTLTKKLRPGKANLTAEFVGNADLTAAKSPVTKVTVKKAAAKITAKLAKKKVKVGKRATLRVRVTSANVKPGGKVKITITKGKKVRTLTVKVKAGRTVKVTLPKLVKGKYKVKAQYQGTKDVAKKSAKTVTLRVR